MKELFRRLSVHSTKHQIHNQTDPIHHVNPTTAAQERPRATRAFVPSRRRTHRKPPSDPQAPESISLECYIDLLFDNPVSLLNRAYSTPLAPMSQNQASRAASRSPLRGHRGGTTELYNSHFGDDIEGLLSSILRYQASRNSAETALESLASRIQRFIDQRGQPQIEPAIERHAEEHTESNNERLSYVISEDTDRPPSPIPCDTDAEVQQSIVDDVCPICYTDLLSHDEATRPETSVGHAACQHVFCKDCLVKCDIEDVAILRPPTCPYCRVEYDHVGHGTVALLPSPEPEPEPSASEIVADSSSDSNSDSNADLQPLSKATATTRPNIILYETPSSTPDTKSPQRRGKGGASWRAGLKGRVQAFVRRRIGARGDRSVSRADARDGVPGLGWVLI